MRKFTVTLTDAEVAAVSDGLGLALAGGVPLRAEAQVVRDLFSKVYIGFPDERVAVTEE